MTLTFQRDREGYKARTGCSCHGNKNLKLKKNNVFLRGTPRYGDRGNTVVKVLCYSGTAVAQWLRCCATVGLRQHSG